MIAILFQVVLIFFSEIFSICSDETFAFGNVCDFQFNIIPDVIHLT